MLAWLVLSFKDQYQYQYQGTFQYPKPSSMVPVIRVVHQCWAGMLALVGYVPGYVPRYVNPWPTGSCSAEKFEMTCIGGHQLIHAQTSPLHIWAFGLLKPGKSKCPRDICAFLHCWGMVRVLGYVLKDGGLMRIWRNHEKCKELATKREKLEALALSIWWLNITNNHLSLLCIDLSRWCTKWKWTL